MEYVGYLTTVIVLLFVCGGAMGWLSKYFQRKKKPPRLAGTAIPQIGEGFDINKRYDIVYSCGDFSSHHVERLQGVKILGYVGNNEEETKMYVRSRWLVVEFTDGRKAYLMPHAITSLQEAEEPRHKMADS